MNKSYYTGVFSKNNAYIHKVSSSLYNKNEDYIESKNIIQINFDNFYYLKSNKEIYKFVYKEYVTNEIDKESEIKYHINLTYIYDTCYNKPVNKLSKFERYCLLLMSKTKKFADTISRDDNIMKKVSKRLENLSNDEKMIGLYDAEIETEKIRKTQIRGAKEEGKLMGANEKAIEIAKNMLKREDII